MKITPALLKRLVLEEAAKLKAEGFGKMKDVEDAPTPKETEADEYADTLEQKIDYLKALKVKEARLEADLKRIREKKDRLTKVVSEALIKNI
jgi:hypothetical protein